MTVLFTVRAPPPYSRVHIGHSAEIMNTGRDRAEMIAVHTATRISFNH